MEKFRSIQYNTFYFVPFATILTLQDHLDFQWLPKAPERDSEWEEEDAPRLQLQSLDQDSEPAVLKWEKNFG